MTGKKTDQTTSEDKTPWFVENYYRIGFVGGIVVLLLGIILLIFAKKPEDFYAGLTLLPMGVALAWSFGWYVFASEVPPNTIVVITHRHNQYLEKILRPGTRYYPRTKYADDHHETHYDTSQILTDFVGKYAVTWQIDLDNFEAFLHCPSISTGTVDGLRWVDSGWSTPINNFRKLLNANSEVDFNQYASLYGIKILKIDPPLGTPDKKPPGAPLGICYCHNETVPLSYEGRKQHVYIAGKTKSGKSTLLLNMAVADIRAGKGVGFLDPHGDSVRELLTLIPRERADDVIFISGDHPQPISIMESRSDTEEDILLDDIHALLRGMSDTWGDRMDSIFTNTLRALLSAKQCTFLDIYHFLVDPDFRQKVLHRVDDPAILRFWENYHPPNYPRGSEQPILSRMEKFITRPKLSAILGSETGIDIYDLMQSGKILLVDTSRRAMGEHTGRVLGGLIMTKCYQAAMRRAELPESARTPFYLYVDEFQSFIATNIENILSETRKYGISLTLAHQYLSQIPEPARKAIFGNVGTMIFFQLGYDDAKYLSHQLGPWEVDHILNLSMELHESIVRPVKGAAYTWKMKTLPPPKPEDNVAQEILSRQSKHDKRKPAHSTEPDDDEVRMGVLPPK